MIEHEITVKHLKYLLSRLRDDDVLIPNKVDLSVLRRRQGCLVYVGFIDLLRRHQHVGIFAGEKKQ